MDIERRKLLRLPDNYQDIPKAVRSNRRRVLNNSLKYIKSYSRYHNIRFTEARTRDNRKIFMIEVMDEDDTSDWPSQVIFNSEE